MALCWPTQPRVEGESANTTTRPPLASTVTCKPHLPVCKGIRGTHSPVSTSADVSCSLPQTGSTLPAVLHKLGLISYSDSLTAALQQQQLPCGPEERALRAAAVAAADAVVEAVAAAVAAGSSGGSSDAPFSAYELSCYLLAQVKEDEGSGGGLRFGGDVLRPHTTLATTAY